jgi:hypothetical protein
MVRHQSDVVWPDIRLYNDHPMAVGSDVRVGRVGWLTDILWIEVCYQGLEIYFACWFFLAFGDAYEPLNLVQEEFHCAYSSKARGKAAKSR